MIIKTRGLVLKFIRYRETSIIVNIYTEALGIQSYIVNSVRSARSKKAKIALYQPLTLLDLVVYHKEKSQLQRISEAKCLVPFTSIPINHKKAAIALFLVEVLGKTLKEQAENQPLFTFLWESIRSFDQLDDFVENFHLIFLFKLSHYLGFGADSARELVTQLQAQPTAPTITDSDWQGLEALVGSNYGHTLTLSNKQRQKLLQILLSFYQWHVEQFAPIKSLPVLNQIFAD